MFLLSFNTHVLASEAQVQQQRLWIWVCPLGIFHLSFMFTNVAVVC